MLSPHVLQKVVETDVEDEVVWVQEEEKQDYYTWSSTGTETESDGEPKKELGVTW